MGICTDFIQKEFGCIIETRTKNVSLNTTTATKVLENNPNRVGWVIFNLSTGIAFIGPNGSVTATFGSQLPASGGWLSIIARDEGEFPIMELWGISTGAATTLYVIETIGVRAL